MTMRWRAVILLVATLSVLAGSVKAEEKASGAYDLLDQSALNKALEGMQMRELLTQLSEDVGGGDDSLAQMRIKARLKLVDYRTKRNVPGAKYLDEAADIYTQIIVKFSSDNPTTSPDKWDEALAMQWLAHCRDRLSLAYVAGYLQSNPLALRVQYLHASEEDRRLLGVYAKRAVSEIDKLELILSDLEDEWGQSEYFGLYIVTGESLENIGDSLALRAARTRYFLALSMPRNDPLRVNRLRQALKSAERFTGGDFPSSRASMLLLMGRCYREIGEHDKAVGVLTIASKDSKVTQDMKFQIAFEIARNSIARGRMLGEKAKVLHAGGLASEAKSKLAEADQHFSRVDKTELPAVQQQGKLRYANGDRFDLVYAVLMKLHLYENWARAFEEDEPDKASAIALQAQKATVDAFKDLQSDTRMFNYLAKVLALKFADEKDLTKLNSMIIYSMSVQVYNKAIRANKSGDDVQAKELLARAEELLDAISGREDDLSKSISHLVLWQHANVKYYQKENLRSAELFTQVAKEYPQSQNAFTAAKNACIIYASIAKKLGESLKPDIRQDFIDALVTLLETNEDWTKQASTWWFDLGWQRQAMAETKPDAEARELLTEAMAAYKNVPEKPLGPYLQSQNQSVMIRVQMFELAAAGDQKNLAGDLAKDLANYSVLLQKKSVSGELEPEQNAMLREWGAVADFHNARIRYDVLKEAAALQELEKLPEKWKGTKILLGAAQYRIGKLIDEGRNSEATKELDSFEEDYGAAKATDLKIRILNAMRKQIEKLKRADANAERDKELAKKRAIVYKYSTDLFKQLQVRNAPKAQLYIAEQSVAFALYETGKAADALKIYEELAAYDALGRKKKADDITTEFTAILKNIKDAKGDETKAKSRAEDLLARVSKDVDPASLPACLQVLEKLLALNTAEGDEVEQISDQLTDDTVLAAEAYSKRLRVRLKIDVTNVLGVARCHGHDSLKNYDQALVAYNKLTRGIDKYARSKLYWETWQEYFELQFKAFGGKKDIMTKMAMQIRSLRSADETGSMGGLKREFLKQEQKAEKLAE